MIAESNFKFFAELMQGKFGDQACLKMAEMHFLALERGDAAKSEVQRLQALNADQQRTINDLRVERDALRGLLLDLAKGAKS